MSDHAAYVIDATHEPTESGMCVFCPVEFDTEARDTGHVVTGMMYLSATAPGRIVGVYHSDGEEAGDAWVERNWSVFERIGCEP